MEEVAWGEYDEHGNMLGEICYGCAEMCGQLRPGLSPEQCLVTFQGKDEKSEKMKLDMESGLKAKGDEDIEGQFLPSSNVDHNQSYSFVVYQDVGLLSEAEFTRICRTTPSQAGFGTAKNKKQALTFSFFGPKSKEKYYQVGLNGVPPEEIHGMRKMRIQFSDSVPVSEVWTGAGADVGWEASRT